MSWSSGKDSAWALHELRNAGNYEVIGLLTTLNDSAERVTTHAVRQKIVVEQAQQLGLPLYTVLLPQPCSNAVYEARIHAKLKRICDVSDIVGVAFGDLLIEDIRVYREKQFHSIGLQSIFPLWNRPTETLAIEMINNGIRAIITCVDLQQLDKSFVGREFNQSFLDDLPDNVDPCGENGEYHTCVFSGPMFRNDIDIEIGKIVHQDGFVFADLDFNKS